MPGLLGHAFSAQHGGERVAFRVQSAMQRLTHAARAAGLERELAPLGLAPEHAQALAYNCVLLHDVLGGAGIRYPRDVAERFSLHQIAALCRLYCEHMDDAWEERGAVKEDDDV